MNTEEMSAFEAGKAEGVAEERERILTWLVDFAFSNQVSGEGHLAVLAAGHRLRKNMSPTEREAKVR